jgi:hypothetical protein
VNHQRISSPNELLINQTKTLLPAMSEKKSEQQRNHQNNNNNNNNDKKHRKLVRSPEKLSPCDLDPSFNPSFLSTNIFAALQSNSRSSPTTKNCYNDQFPPNSSAACSSSLPPSTSTPSIALYRKPSITIKYSKDEVNKTDQSSLTHRHQQISKSIDSNHPFTNTISTTKQHADQTSNNFLINFNGVPGCCLHNNSNQLENVSLFSYNDEFSGSRVTTAACDIQQNFAHSPTSQSLNLNLSNQSSCDYSSVTTGQMVFNSNNPFLNDTFDAIIAHEDEGGGKINTNFFNIDDNNESEFLYLAEETTKKACEEMDEQLLKNKREKFSNASTMKICLVVSPPTNKLFQVSNRLSLGSCYSIIILLLIH